jgi:hypothetical protein
MPLNPLTCEVAARLRVARLTCPEVGRTVGNLADSYDHVRRSALLGSGSRVFAGAVTALMSWQVHLRAGIGVSASERPLLAPTRCSTPGSGRPVLARRARWFMSSISRVAAGSHTRAGRSSRKRGGSLHRQPGRRRHAHHGHYRVLSARHPAGASSRAIRPCRAAPGHRPLPPGAGRRRVTTPASSSGGFRGRSRL